MAKKSKQATIQAKGLAGVTQNWWMNRRTVAGILFGLAFLLYANSIPNGFVLDDSVVITKNQFTVKGFSGLGGIFSNDTFQGYYGEDNSQIKIIGGRYRPLSIAFFAVLHQIFGANSTVYHLWNVLMYAVCCAFLYLVLRRIFTRVLSAPDAAILTGLSVLLFTVHPVHTEVVNNIKSNDEILCLLLSLGSLHFALKFWETGKKNLALWSGVLLFLACLAKENGITFLAVIPFTLWMTGKAGRKKSLSFMPLLASLGVSFLVYFMLRYAVIGWSMGAAPLDLINNPFIKFEAGQWVHCSYGEKMAMTFCSLGKYLQLLVFPLALSTDYYPRYVDVITFASPGAIISLILYLALGGFVLYKLLKKQNGPVVYGVFFFLATLSIVSNIVFPIGTNLAERFLFFPSVGFSLAIAGFLLPFISKEGRSANRVILAAFGIVVLAFAGRTFIRNFDFESNKTLFSKDVKVSENSAKMQNALGAIIAEEALTTNDKAKKAELSGQAMQHLNKSLVIHPTYLEAFYMRGNVHFMQGKLEAAIDDYRKCLNLNPDFKDAYGNYALALREAARNYLQPGGDFKKALTYLEESNRIYPGEPETLKLLETARRKNSQ